MQSSHTAESSCHGSVCVPASTLSAGEFHPLVGSGCLIASSLSLSLNAKPWPMRPAHCYRCIDPLDGTCNFAHSYPGFCVSIGVLRHALPVAGCVIEFTGRKLKWWAVRTAQEVWDTIAACPVFIPFVFPHHTPVSSSKDGQQWQTVWTSGLSMSPESPARTSGAPAS